MKSFYHESISKNLAGFLKSSIIFLVIILVIGFAVSKFATWDQIKQMFGQGKYKNVSLDSLVAYSNLYSGQLVCTQGINAKSHDFNVLKSSLKGNEFTNAILVKYAKGKESDFDSFILEGAAAAVDVCGKFEAQRGQTVGSFGVWNSKITIDTYKLLDTPKPFTFN